ncbi:unnamed protein product [Bursaphelenchus xylophilus]|uniref:(pine wood nematode) hypothetical protein n=1 Tax=Bursaphelenchus xylophilus TaxID=6326 RepID=A0A1I7RPS9_BURXY|nr:unnamed protein product [Bursaphelenchus xylophilus]CAG9096554.1 unnamed protein product [Bursaphelenchus xylophilus]
MTSEEEDDLGIKPEAVISAGKGNYVVDCLLGEGGFGAVYKVHLESNPRKFFAMKVEKKLETRKDSKLKMEIAILKAVAEKKQPKKPTHFTEIIDRAKKDTFTLIVMQLVGKSLADLKASCPSKVFSTSTGLGVGSQCLQAVEELHGAKFVHRDIKPANYAVGLEEKSHTVYILDFGIARRFVKSDGELKTPREGIGFKGTVRFASLACHRNFDVGPIDDVESWFYLLIDILIPKGLPWKKLSDKHDVRKAKEEFRSKGTFLSTFPDIKYKMELLKIFEYIQQTQYCESVDYNYIYKMLELAAKISNVPIDAAFEWENAKSKESSVSQISKE